jgi:hypothetical protein
MIGRTGSRWVDIKIYCIEMRLDVVNWINLAQDRLVGGGFL